MYNLHVKIHVSVHIRYMRLYNMYVYVLFFKIKQEMELILSHPRAQLTFCSEWSMKWAPAIISYCRSLKKKDVVKVKSLPLRKFQVRV